MKELIFQDKIYRFSSNIKTGIYLYPDYHCVLLEKEENFEKPILFLFTYEGELLEYFSFLDIYSTFEKIHLDDDIFITGVDGMHQILFYTSKGKYFHFPLKEYLER